MRHLYTEVHLGYEVRSLDEVRQMKTDLKT